MQHLYSIGQKRPDLPAIKHSNFLVNIHVGQTLLITTDQRSCKLARERQIGNMLMSEDTLYPPNSDRGLAWKQYISLENINKMSVKTVAF